MSSQLEDSPSESPSGSSSVRLTRDRVRRLAEALVEGRTRKGTAAALGVSPRTVTRWKKNPAVVAEFERLLNRGPETRALEKLDRLLDSPDDKVALRAAEFLVRRDMQRLGINAGRR